MSEKKKVQDKDTQKKEYSKNIRMRLIKNKRMNFDTFKKIMK